MPDASLNVLPAPELPPVLKLEQDRQRNEAANKPDWANAVPEATAPDWSKAVPDPTPTADWGKAQRVYTADDVSKTPVMDLVNDKEFDPKSFAIQNPEAATDPKVLGQLREVYRQHKIAGVKTSDIAKGVAEIPSAVGSIGKGVWDRIKNLETIFLQPAVNAVGSIVTGDAFDKNKAAGMQEATRNQVTKAAGETSAAMESAVQGMANLGKGAVEKWQHSNPIGRATGGNADQLWENMSPGELDQHFFSDVENAKQTANIAQGEGENMARHGRNASELATKGIELDPKNIESLSLTDPVTLVAFEGGFQVVNTATGAVLAKAATSALAKEAVQKVKDLAFTAGRQAVGQPIRAAGKGLELTGKLAEKAGHAGVPAAILKAVEGDWKSAAGIGAAALSAPLVKKAGTALGEIGENLAKGDTLNTGARRIVDLGKATGVALGDIGKGAVVGAGMAEAGSDGSPDEVKGLVSMGGAFGAIHGAKEGAGKLVEGEFIQPKQTPLARQARPVATENPAADQITDQALKALPEDARNQINFVRNLGRKLGARVYVYPDEAAGAKMAQQVTGTTPENAASIAKKQGFTSQITGADGKPVTVVFLNGDATAAAHEVFGHVLEKMLTPEMNSRLDEATKASFSPEEWEQKGEDYANRPGVRTAGDTRPWREVLGDFGLDADTYLAREGRAENADALWRNRGADIGTPDDLYRRIVGAVGRTAEAVGAPLVQAKSANLQHPVSLDIQARTDAALRKVLGDKKAQEVIQARDIELRKATKQTATPVTPATPAAPVTPATPVATPATPVATPATPTATPSRTEWVEQNLKSQNLEDAEKWAEEHGDDKAKQLVSTIAENQRANPEEPSPLRVTRQSVKEEDPEQGRTGRRAERQKAYDSMDAATRERVKDVVALIKMERIKKDNGMHMVGADMNHVVDNAQRLAEQLAILPDAARHALSPYETDLKTKSFTPAAWDELMNDYYDYTVNQRSGFKGGGSEAMIRPKGATESRVSLPPEREGFTAAQLPREKELFLNLLNGPAATIPKTARVSRKGGVPGNIVAQDIASANAGDLVKPRHPISGAPEFEGFPGREIMDTNPLRAQMIQSGIAAHELRDVEARFNLKDVENITPLSTVNFQARNTDTVRGGFLPKEAEDVAAMSPEDFFKWAKSQPRQSVTPAAYRLGLSVKDSPEDVADLKSKYDSLQNDASSLLRDGNFEQAQVKAVQAQFFREAHEAATNTGSAKRILKDRPELAGQAMPSDHPDAVKVGAVVRDDQTGRLFKGVTHYSALDNRKQDMHDEGKPLGHRVTQGFVSNSGEFLTRWQAAKRAEEHGQIPPGYFDSKPGSMGLESTMFEHYNTEFKPDMGDSGENHPRGAFQALPTEHLFKAREMDDELGKVRDGKSDGQTFNLDGSVFAPPKGKKLDVVTLASENIPVDELSPERVRQALAPYAEAMTYDDDIKPGVFKMADGKTVSIDLNAVVDQAHRKNSVAFARDNDQQAIFDLDKFENVITGGKGNTVLHTPEHIAKALPQLIAGEPVDVAGISKTPQRYEGAALPKSRRNKAAEDEFKMKPGSAGGFTRAWILPSGKVEQLGDTWHHDFLANDPAGIAAAKKYGVTVPPFEGTDADGVREGALTKGFVRVNLNRTNGLLQIEARAKDWGKQKAQVQQLVESNVADIDKMKVNLLDDAGTKLKDSAAANLFEYDDREKLEHLPFISEGAEEVRNGPLSNIRVPITAEKSEAVWGGYGGEPIFKVFDKAGNLVATEKNYGKAEEHAEKIGGSIEMKRSYASAALPKKLHREFWIAPDGKVIPAPSGHYDAAIDHILPKSWKPENPDDPMASLYPDVFGKGYIRALSNPEAIHTDGPSLTRQQRQTLEDLSFEHSRELTHNDRHLDLGIDGQSLPKKATLAEDLSLPGLDVGRSYNRRAISEMTKEELKQHFPEAVVPKSSAEEIPSNIVGSPLYKEAGDRQEAVKAFSDKLVDFAKEHQADPDFDSGAKWYSEFTPMLKKEFGDDAPIFAELLAATSPQTDPHQNFNYAFEAYQKYKRGDFNKMLEKLQDGFGRLEDGKLEAAYKRDVPAEERPENISPATLMRWWIDKHDLIPRSEGGKKIGLHSDAVLQVLARRWLTQSKGPKTLNFVQNLIGTGDEATIDLWADRTMRRLGYSDHKERWRILPENVHGVTDEDFAFSQEAFRHAAERLNMKPSALQGALWFAEKKLWSDKGWSQLNLGDYRKEIQDIDIRRRGWAQKEQLKGPMPIRKKGAKQEELLMTN